MLPHGTATTETIEVIIDLTSKDDLIIDGGNSHFSDTIKRGDYRLKIFPLKVDL